MNTIKRVFQKRTLCVLVLVLILSNVLAGCKPTAPETSPAGSEVEVHAGKSIAFRVSAKRADEYEWTLQQSGQVSVFNGETFLYNAPAEGGIAVLGVTARNRWGTSSQTSLTITILPPPLSGRIAIKPTNDLVLKGADCIISGAQGTLDAQGTISLSGLSPNQAYRLTLNGWQGVSPNDELLKIAPVPGKKEGFWDFDTEVVADANGKVEQRPLQATLPSGVELYPDTTYKVKFFVKDADSFCAILGHDEFWFTIEAVQ